MMSEFRREEMPMADSARTPQIVPEVLGAIPIIKWYCDRLKIIEAIDTVIPKAPQSPVSHGECVVALLISVLHGDHRICFVDEKLRDVDLEKLFGRKGIEPAHFNDTRIGVTLDALFSHTGRIYGNIVSGALRLFGIRPKRLHLDTTTVVLHGLFQVLEVLPSFREAPPIPAHGFSKDHRNDLLQVMFGLVNSDEGIPIMGRFENGNAADTKLFRNYMAECAGMLDEIRAWNAVMVGDTKLCTVDTIAEAVELGFPLITLLPETFSWRKEFIGKASREADLPHILTTEEGEVYHGKSFKFPVGIDRPGRASLPTWLRVLVVHSSQLAEKKRDGRKRALEKEAQELAKLAKRLEKVHFACQADAEKIANRDWAAAKPLHHTMSMTLRQEETTMPEKRPGRPSKQSSPPPTAKRIWRVTLAFREAPQEERPFDPDGFFVLITSVTDLRVKSDAQLLEAYKGQYVVETSFKWLKGPLEAAPLFLQLPSRIQSLGFVFLLGILFAALLQREARRALKKRGGKVPNYPGRRSDTPTWQGILALFEKVGMTTVTIGDQCHRAFHRLDADQKEVLTLLGIPEIYEEYSNRVYN